MGFDFAIFWQAACAYLQGASPYSVNGFAYPLAFVWVMLPFAMLPQQTAYVLWTLFNLGVLVGLARKRAPMALLFLPVFFTLWVGQVDLFILAAGWFGGWAGLALATLKPQLAVWLWLWKFLQWRKEKQYKKIVLSLCSAGAIHAVAFIIWPGWLAAWRSSTSSVVDSASRATSFFGAGALLPIPSGITFLIATCLAALTFWQLRPLEWNRFWCWVAAFNPLSSPYSLCVLLDQVDWVAILLSWLALPAVLALHTNLPWVVVPAYLYWNQRKRTTLRV